MSGFFVVGEKKERPGVYKRYENAGGVEAAGARSGVGCALVTGNWGALNKPVTIDQSTDVSNVIGAGSGYDAITAFMAGGMEECVVVRVGTGGTPATITLKDTTTSAAVDAVVLTALYPGNRAFTITVKASLDDETAKEATIYEGTKALEEDRDKIWDNRDAWKNLNVLNGTDLVEVVLKSGEKDEILAKLDEISGYQPTMEDVAKN